MAKLPPQPIGVAPGSSYWNDWYEKLRTFVDQITTSVDWAIVTNTPTTLAGYGISTTGTGAAVAQTSPTLVTPNIGNATGSSLNLNISSGTTLHVKQNNNTAASNGLIVENSADDTQFQFYYNNAANTWRLGPTFGSTGAYKSITFRTSDTNALIIDTSQNVRIIGGLTTGNAILHTTSVALTNGAAAALGTLTNAPVAGPPTKWIPIVDNGTTRYIPAW